MGSPVFPVAFGVETERRSGKERVRRERNDARLLRKKKKISGSGRAN